MWEPATSEFPYADEIRWDTIFSTQVLPKLIEDGPQVEDSTLDIRELCRVESESKKIAEAQFFGNFADYVPGNLCLPRPAVATGPGTAVDPSINRAIRLRVSAFDAQATAILAPPHGAGVAVRRVSVSIIRYRVK
jgi:hypothetical protein